MTTSSADRRHQDRIILVTGASSGLGLATAHRLASEGATVAAVARDSDRLHGAVRDIVDGGGKAVAVPADLLDPSECQGAVDRCIADIGPPTAVVNVAGAHTMRHTTDTTNEEWDRDLALNLSAPFHVIRAALPTLLESGGSILNVASIAGLEAQAYSAGYCAAKHGLIGLTRALALEYINTGVRINAVCPGGMNTPQVQNFSIPEDANLDLVLAASTPRGIAETSDVTPLISFLLGEEAAAIHGAVYPVDNGKMA